MRYTDFAASQRSTAYAERFETDLDYWRNQLKGAASPIQLPFDRPRPSVQTFHGAELRFHLDDETTTALHQLAREESATLFMVLVACFKATLFRWSLGDEVSVGTPLANRNRPEIEGLIGLFVNTVVLRTQLGGNPGFRELLRQVRQTTLEAYAHGEAPFEKVVEALLLKRNLGHAPLFQTAFTLENIPIDEVSLPDLVVHFPHREISSAKFDLTLTMKEDEQRLMGSFEYNTDLFNRSTIERMMAHFRRLVTTVARKPNHPIRDIPLMDEAETRCVLNRDRALALAGEPAPRKSWTERHISDPTRPPSCGPTTVPVSRRWITAASTSRPTDCLINYARWAWNRACPCASRPSARRI